MRGAAGRLADDDVTPRCHALTSLSTPTSSPERLDRLRSAPVAADVAQSLRTRRCWPPAGSSATATATRCWAGLDAVAARAPDGAFPFAADDEDIHMAIERRLTEIVGPVGGRLHTARSRNDQVATDVAIFSARGAGAREAIGR